MIAEITSREAQFLWWETSAVQLLLNTVGGNKQMYQGVVTPHKMSTSNGISRVRKFDDGVSTVPDLQNKLC